MSDKPNMADKPESARMWADQSAWIDLWVEESGQDRTAVIRAAVSLLRFLTANMPFDRKVRLIANFSRVAEDTAIGSESSPVRINDLRAIFDVVEAVKIRLSKLTENDRGTVPLEGPDSPENVVDDVERQREADHRDDAHTRTKRHRKRA